MHFSQILNSGERQKIYHKNADDGAHQINHPVRNYFIPFVPNRQKDDADSPVRLDPLTKSGRTSDGKRINDEKIGNGLE